MKRERDRSLALPYNRRFQRRQTVWIVEMSRVFIFELHRLPPGNIDVVPVHE